MNPNLRSPLDAEEAALAARFASLPGGEPSPALDARVLAHAHAAVRRRPPLLRWGGAAAAVLALGVGIRVVMAPVDMTPREEDMAPASTPVPTQEAVRAEVDSNVLMDSAPQTEAAADRIDPTVGARTSTPATAPAGPRDEPAPVARKAVPVTRQAPPAQPPAAAASEAPRVTPQARDAMQALPPPAPASPMAAPAPAPPAPEAFPAPAAPVTVPESGRTPPAAPVLDERRAESRERALGASKAAPLSAAEQEAALSVEGMASLDALVNEARRLHASGDTAGLRTLLRHLAVTYPGAPLPEDVQGWLDALQAER